jgi:hypothetical protein
MYIAYAPDQESAIWKPKHTITINTSHPFQISSPEAVTIEPLCKLDSAFANRYRNIPAELKIHILTPLLIPSGQTPPLWIQSKLVPAIDYELWKIPLTRWTLFHYLHSSKEIACVVLNIFYVKNTFRIGCQMLSIDGTRRYSPRYFLRPRPPIAAHLRKIKYVMGVTRAEWMTLFDLAVGLHGFDNLTRVDVVIWLDLGKFNEDDEEWPGMKNGGMS